VTVSIGVAGTDGRAATPDEIVRAADEALYRAKQGGRNQVRT
jgi:diguanylate cyclase (GGDEF)-like protein